mmetsp:Transcript_3664/g.7656  ORF Transcript_3664/g.7656 Transcript_3664/m.7656 type:complete len:202 (+) Transcript_3664:389-994(+)
MIHRSAFPARSAPGIHAPAAFRAVTRQVPRLIADVAVGVRQIPQLSEVELGPARSEERFDFRTRLYSMLEAAALVTNVAAPSLPLRWRRRRPLSSSPAGAVRGRLRAVFGRVPRFATSVAYQMLLSLARHVGISAATRDGGVFGATLLLRHFGLDFLGPFSARRLLAAGRRRGRRCADVFSHVAFTSLFVTNSALVLHEVR